MSLLQRILSGSRLKDARKRLAGDPSARNYLALAQEHARLGEMAEVARVCGEALELLGAHSELQRLCDRARALLIEKRTRALTRELRDAPRPGIYKELSELLMQSGRIERAEEVAFEWFTATGEGNAQLQRAQARHARYLADRSREDGRLNYELLESDEKLLPRDARPLRERIDLVCAVAAWRDARKTVSQLLELTPGDSGLEARFRTYNGLADAAPTFDAALREVERTGTLALEARAHGSPAVGGSKIRPTLQMLAAQPGVQAAMFERGATALVQGPKGATAERTARAVREIATKSRTTARRLGLGATLEIELEGAFGSVLIAPGEQGSAALWTNQSGVSERFRSTLLELAGAAAPANDEEDAA